MNSCISKINKLLQFLFLFALPNVRYLYESNFYLSQYIVTYYIKNINPFFFVWSSETKSIQVEQVYKYTVTVVFNVNSNMTWFFSPIKSTDANSALFPDISALAHWQ